MTLLKFLAGLAVVGVIAASASGCGSSSSSSSRSVVKWYVFNEPGGSYDLYARLAANHIKRYIPGNPNIIIEHRPGGGGIRAVTQFYAQSPRDGTVMGLFPESIAHSQVMQPELSNWNLAEMAYVGSIASVNPALVRRKDAPGTARLNS